MTISPDAILAAIDRHLAAIPAGRSTVTVEEHRDVLLDLRNTVAPAAGSVAAWYPPVAVADPDGHVELFDAGTTDPDDFEIEVPFGSVPDPALSGLDLAREVTLPAESRVDDFPDEDRAAAVAPEPELIEAAPEPAPGPQRVAVIHLRLASSALGVLARCGHLVDADAGDSSTPWGEDVTCPDCLDQLAGPADTETSATEAATTAFEAADAGEPQATAAAAALHENDGAEPSWIDDDGDHGPLVHQLIEVQGSGHGAKRHIIGACGNVEIVGKSEPFTESAQWPDAVTCPDCIARRHQPKQAAA